MKAARVGLGALMLALALNYLLAAISIASGDFDRIGLPAVMITMEFWGNLLQGFGWIVVLIAWRGSRSPAGAALAAFMAGMFFCDVLTTWPLDMPLPPGFLYWGSAAALLQLGIARLVLGAGADHRTPHLPMWHWALLLLATAGFAILSILLTPTAVTAAGLPPEVAPLHRLTLAAMSVTLALIVVLLWHRKAVGVWALYPLAGMWCWEMLTTALLTPWPGPPAQAWWGPFSVAALLAVALRQHPPSAQGT